MSRANARNNRVTPPDFFASSTYLLHGDGEGKLKVQPSLTVGSSESSPKRQKSFYKERSKSDKVTSPNGEQEPGFATVKSPHRMHKPRLNMETTAAASSKRLSGGLRVPPVLSMASSPSSSGCRRTPLLSTRRRRTTLQMPSQSRSPSMSPRPSPAGPSSRTISSSSSSSSSSPSLIPTSLNNNSYAPSSSSLPSRRKTRQSALYRSHDDSSPLKEPARPGLTMMHMNEKTFLSSSLPLNTGALDIFEQQQVTQQSPNGLSLLDSMDDEMEFDVQGSPGSFLGAIPPTPKRAHKRQNIPRNLFTKAISHPVRNNSVDFGSPRHSNRHAGEQMNLMRTKNSTASASATHTDGMSFQAAIDDTDALCAMDSGDEARMLSPYASRRAMAAAREPTYGLPGGTGLGCRIQSTAVYDEAHVQKHGPIPPCFSGAQAIMRFMCQTHCPLFTDPVYFNHIDIARLMVSGGGVVYCLRWLRVLLASGVKFMSMSQCTEAVTQLHTEHIRTCRAVMDHLTAASCNILPHDVRASLSNDDIVSLVEDLGTKRDTVVYLWILDSRSEHFADLGELHAAIAELHATWGRNRMDSISSLGGSSEVARSRESSELSPSAVDRQSFDFTTTTVSSFLRSSQCKLFPPDLRRSMDIDDDLLQDVIKQVGEHGAVTRFRRLARDNGAYDSFHAAAEEVLGDLREQKQAEERRNERNIGKSPRLTLAGLKVSIPCDDQSYFRMELDSGGGSRDGHSHNRWTMR
jgi:hypothetical protein